MTSPPPKLVSLTTSGVYSSPDAPASLEPKIIGGKGASLAKMGSIPSLASHIPNSHALTVEFFQPWIDTLLGEEKNLGTLDEAGCDRLQALCHTLTLNTEQQSALDQLVRTFATTETHSTLLAVRSSAPEEDGTTTSFAGAFDTHLGVPASNLEQAVRDCFASRFDARVFQYMQSAASSDVPTNGNSCSANTISFAVVVMEMVDSHIAGVAFSANPLNSDRDEMVVDSSFGLGESVVEGSVTADRYVYDKVSIKVVSATLGKKTLEKKLVECGVETATISDLARQEASSLTEAQLHELAELVCEVEKAYGMPMDVEWAYAYIRDSNLPPVLRLLQARPITTLFSIDANMMTAPGEKRILYYDYNVVSDCTTTDPFTHMDINFYGWASSAMMGFPDRDIFTDDPTMPLFKASTRQYCNLSIFLKYMSTETCSKSAQVLDPYLASLFASQDCDGDKYAMKTLPQGVNLRNLWKLLRQFPFGKLYKIGKAGKKDPKQASLEYQKIVRQDMAKFEALEERGPIPVDEEGRGGLQSFADELFQAMTPSFEQELGLLFFVILVVFKKLEKEHREGKTEEIRSEYGALCGGYEGDGLMEMNIDIHRLANHLPEKTWQEYPHEDLHKLASRIQANLDGQPEPDLPLAFLEEWRTFMNRHGWDGQNQLFPSCPRYRDSPVLLLAKLRQNVGAGVTNPVEIQREQVENRRCVMALHEERAKENKSCFRPFELSQIQERNACLEHLMWIRNAPKLHLTEMCGILRGAVLNVEEDFLQSGRLTRKGDIFHVTLHEVDRALREESLDLMELVRPRKAAYERALRAKECPMLVDSRCRILRADPPQRGGGEEEDGTLIGAAVSPGIATGRVRILHNPSERFERGEILAAVVTGPAWTPMFAGASAIILQVGGALQHGALCAREYGKPAVSNIDIHSLLKTGMLVTVDGSTGTIKILQVEVDED